MQEFLDIAICSMMAAVAHLSYHVGVAEGQGRLGQRPGRMGDAGNLAKVLVFRIPPSLCQRSLLTDAS